MFRDRTLTDFEKLAADVQLPEDPNTWAQEILQELHKQVSYIDDFDADIVMHKVDAEVGHGFGQIEVRPKSKLPPDMPKSKLEEAGINVARIPIIIVARKLKPLDCLVLSNSTATPLTERRLRRALFRPQTFDQTAKTPGDTSMLGTLFPPYRQNYGFGTGNISGVGMGKFGGLYDGYDGSTGAEYAPKHTYSAAVAHRSEPERPVSLAIIPHKSGGFGFGVHGSSMELVPRSLMLQHFPELSGAHDEAFGKGGWGEAVVTTNPATKQASVLAHIMPTIHAADFRKFASALRGGLADCYDSNPATYGATSLLSNYSPPTDSGDGTLSWDVKKASVMQISRLGGGKYSVKVANNKLWEPKSSVINRGELYKFAGADVVKDVDIHGSVTVGANSVEQPKDSTEDYKLVDKSGIWKVQTVDGTEAVGYCFTDLIDVDGTKLPLALFTNGTASAVQGEIAGVQVSVPSELPTGPAAGYGFWARYLPNGSVEATVPMQITNKVSGPAGVDFSSAFMAETYDGRRIMVTIQKHMRQAAGIGDKMLLPESFVWVPMKGTSVALVSNPLEMGKTKTAQANALRMLSEVTLRGGGSLFSVEGHPVEKLAHAQKHDLGIDETMFLLAGMGVRPEDAITKMAETNSRQAPVQVRVSGSIKTAAMAWKDGVAKVAAIAAVMPKAVELWKEASVLPDPTAVDTVLSLGFLNPENITSFIEALPIIDKAQSRMVDLLISTRLGMRDVPEGALERAIKNCEEVIDGLKVLAFSNN